MPTPQEPPDDPPSDRGTGRKSKVSIVLAVAATATLVVTLSSGPIAAWDTQDPTDRSDLTKPAEEPSTHYVNSSHAGEPHHGHRTPSSEYLGYGGPDVEGEAGGEFTFGAPPEPPESEPAGLARPSISEATSAARTGRLDELDDTYSPDAKPAKDEHLFTSDEQAGG